MEPLDPATWTRIEAILEEALDLDGAGREAYLQKACGDDVLLRKQVDEFLRADASTRDFMDRPAADYAASLMDDEDSEPATTDPEAVPPYRLLRPVGRGGMGTVYLAERADGEFEQRVAIKLIHPGAEGSEPIRRRFHRERQILAGLEHPNIARLLDGGVSRDGQPFFAMEFVEGESILAYADRKRLTVDKRLTLFEQVCKAVAYAQTHLVVHRDLKPSNILVTETGTVKLLDFGIARILEPSEDPGVTLDAARLMTPEYAAPEQVRGDPVTTATDVYALGVVLYELLSGHRPYRKLARVFMQQLQQTVAEEETELASRKITRMLEGKGPDGNPVRITPESVSRVRNTTPGALRRRLSGDLDTILTTALAKDPERRYGTVAALLEDIRRHRRSLPIHARKPSPGYRVSRYLRRHRVGILAATLTAAALVAGSAVALWQARVASREAERATRVKEFMISIFAEADPDRGPAGKVTAKDVLDRGAERLDHQLENEPEMQAELQNILARLYDELGEYEASLVVAGKAVATRRRVLGDDHRLTAESLEHLGTAHYRLGRYAQAESLYQSALTTAEGSGAADRRIASILSNLAGVRQHQGQFSEAESLYVLALEKDLRALGEDDPEVVSDLGNLAVLKSEQGHYAEAESLHHETVEMWLRRAEEHPQNLAWALHNLAFAQADQGKHAEAKENFRKAIELKRRVYGGPHPSLAKSIRSYASTLTKLDDLEGAESQLREALDMTRTLLGDRHEDVAICLNELAVNSFYQGEDAKAAARFRSSLDIFRELLPEDHPKVITLENNIATMEMRAGNLEAAEATYLRILETRLRKLGPEHPDVAQTHIALGNVARRRNRTAEAMNEYGKALAGYIAAYGPDHEDVASARVSLGEACVDAEEYRTAETLFREARETYARELSPDHRSVIYADVAWGRLLTHTGRGDEALPLLQQARNTWGESYGDEDVRTAGAMCTLGLCLLSLGRGDEARPLLDASQPVLIKQLGATFPLTLEAGAALRQLP